jgi:two-component system response regulator NreC
VTSEVVTTRPIGVLLADDHPVVRRALRLLLAAHDDIEIVGESADVIATLSAADRLHPTVAVCDLTMPGGSTLREIPKLVAAGCAVVVLTMQSDPAFAREALRAGASAFVLKDVAAEQLVTAVRAAAAGIGAEPTPAADVRDDGLGPREVEVLTLLALGYTNAEVAAELVRLALDQGLLSTAGSPSVATT